MKTLIPLLVCFVPFASAVLGQDVDKSPVITVTGSAEVMVAPDEVVFSLDVTKTDKDLQLAKRQNDDAVAKILDLAKRFAVLPKNIKTAYTSVNMKYEKIIDPKKKIVDEDGDVVGTRIFRGYEVSKSVTVRLTDITRFEEFFGEVLKTGVSEVNSVTFETSKLRENKDTARDMAMKAAREKAEAMAASIHQTIGKAVRITEGSQNQTYIDGFTGGNMSANTTRTAGKFIDTETVATFAPGAIKIEAQVTVRFLLN